MLTSPWCQSPCTQAVGQRGATLTPGLEALGAAGEKHKESSGSGLFYYVLGAAEGKRCLAPATSEYGGALAAPLPALGTSSVLFHARPPLAWPALRCRLFQASLLEVRCRDLVSLPWQRHSPWFLRCSRVLKLQHGHKPCRSLWGSRAPGAPRQTLPAVGCAPGSRVLCSPWARRPR